MLSKRESLVLFIFKPPQSTMWRRGIFTGKYTNKNTLLQTTSKKCRIKKTWYEYVAEPHDTIYGGDEGDRKCLQFSFVFMQLLFAFVKNWKCGEGFHKIYSQTIVCCLFFPHVVSLPACTHITHARRVGPPPKPQGVHICMHRGTRSQTASLLPVPWFSNNSMQLGCFSALTDFMRCAASFMCICKSRRFFETRQSITNT